MTTSPWSTYRPSDRRTVEPRPRLDAPPPGRLRRDLARARARPGRWARPRRRSSALGECRLDGRSRRISTATAALLGDAACGSSDPRRLQAWWLYRAYSSPPIRWESGSRSRGTTTSRPASSRSTTSVAMRVQNETFKRLGRGPFGDLLRAMLRDPALLVWLDAPSNRKGKPNENLARELMELFTLGVGRFTESDVKECARALTGLGVVQGRFHCAKHPITMRVRRRSWARPLDSMPSRSPRTFSAQPAAADRLAWRLCATFLGEGVADPAARADLADQLRRDGLHVGPWRRDDSSLRALLLGAELAHAGFRPGRVCHRIGAGARALRAAAFHAAARRVDGKAGPGAFLPAECRRLAGRAAMALGPRDRRPSQLRRGARHWADWESEAMPPDLAGLAAAPRVV